MANGMYSTPLMGTGIVANPMGFQRNTTLMGTTMPTTPQVSTPMPPPLPIQPATQTPQVSTVMPTVTQTAQISTVMPNPFYLTVMQNPELIRDELEDRSATIYDGSMLEQMAKYVAEIEKIAAMEKLEKYNIEADLSYNTLYPEYSLPVAEVEKRAGLSQQMSSNQSAFFGTSIETVLPITIASDISEVNTPMTTVPQVLVPRIPTNAFYSATYSLKSTSNVTSLSRSIPVNKFHSIMG